MVSEIFADIIGSADYETIKIYIMTHISFRYMSGWSL